MSKWMIPRHRPKGIPDWERADRNHGKKWMKKGELRKARKERQRERDIGFLDLVQRNMNEDKARIATMQIGQCVRKSKLSEAAARSLVRSAAFEKGKPMYAYKCKWCDSYHLTSHPEPGETYDIFCDGKTFR